MDLLKKRLDIARLIAEELTGTIDEKDRLVLARWLDEDERHRGEYANTLESFKAGNEAGSGAGAARHGIPMGDSELSYGSED